jgi:hypothetical protein
MTKIKCPDCKGKGYFTEEIRMVLRTEKYFPGSTMNKIVYSPDIIKEFTDCERCLGSGEINLIIRDKRKRK